MIKTIFFAAVLLILAVSIVAFIVNAILYAVHHFKQSDKTSDVQRLKSNAIVLLVSGVICAGFTWFSQINAQTPAIRNNHGKVMDESITELKQVTLNGRKQWISIRGYSSENPVLLFLAGGPGGTQMAAVRHDLAELEKHFVVVGWDQPGAGKSYGAARTGDITPDIYIEDGLALTKYLCDEFNQEKIYLMGESWGSALGIFLVDKAPELYHAFIGTGQMVAFVETEIMDYNLAMEIAHERGDTGKIAALEANDLPPYYGSDVTWKSAEYLNYLSEYMARNPQIHNGGYNTFRDLLSPEYGIIDKMNFVRGIINTFNHVYPQLYEIDLRNGYTNLEVPAYFFLGRHDINAPTSLVEDYYELLDAPHKEIVWFEHSGHSPWINESGKFVEETLRVTNKVMNEVTNE